MYELANVTQLRTSWQAASCADAQELFNILWNPKIHHCLQKNSGPDQSLQSHDQISICSMQFIVLYKDDIL